jgi:hypothetical protein
MRRGAQLSLGAAARGARDDSSYHGQRQSIEYFRVTVTGNPHQADSDAKPGRLPCYAALLEFGIGRLGTGPEARLTSYRHVDSEASGLIASGSVHARHCLAERAGDLRFQLET